MQDAETILKTFATRVRQLILKVGELKKANSELTAVVSQRDAEITKLKEQLSLQEKKYNAMMMAKMINITDGDIETSKKKIQKLIRSVNQCMALLNGNEEENDD
ncbi:MAG: hypothetical protein IJV10_01070 [Prevotella sp.]|nr:hypothetical protein [Prevotella sp.]MBR1839428.1 hypothetical protein [Prevotella sp.]